MYKADVSGAWMIYYALLDAKGNLLPAGTICEGETKAYFRVLNSQLRVTVHKQIIKPGIGFYVVAGTHKVAEGVVIEVLNLLDEGVG